MIGDDDAVRAGADGVLRVVRVEDAFEQQRPPRDGASPLDVAPGDRLAFAADHAQARAAFGVEMRRRQVGGHRESRARLPVARADDGGVDGEAERAHVRRLGACEEVARKAAVGLDVDLQPERRCGRGRDLFDRGGARRADDVRRPRRPRPAHGRDLAVRMQHALIGHRRQENGEGERLPRDVDARVDRGDVLEHARPQPDALKGLAIPPQRDLVRRPAGDELVHGLRQARARRELEVIEGEEVHERMICK